MAHWLMKSDPDSYGWPEMSRDRSTNWNGVRNPQATSFLKQMKKGDRALFYHSGEERAVVRNGKIEAAHIMSATLSCDHRAIDGALGAELIGAFRRLIENPVMMMV